MSDWPLTLRLTQGDVIIPGPGRYALIVNEYVDDLEVVTDDVLAAAYRTLGNNAVGWMPEEGGLLSNLPAWENILLSTQWHAPAALPALEARVRGWCEQLGYDTSALTALFSRQPSFLSEDDRRMMGWLRQMLCRPRLLLLRSGSLPAGRSGALLQSMVDGELASTAFLCVDEQAPPNYQPLTPAQRGATP
jgi:hypothetical protein